MTDAVPIILYYIIVLCSVGWYFHKNEYALLVVAYGTVTYWYSLKKTYSCCANYQFMYYI